MKLAHPISFGTLLFATLWVHGEANANPPVIFGTIETGKFSLYNNQNGVDRTDLSGIATDGTHVIMVDDGGDPGPGYGFNYVRVATDVPDTNAVNLPLTLEHVDVEAATYHNGYFYITTSMATEDPAQNRLTRFKIGNGQLVGEQSVNLRASLFPALREAFGDEWVDSWKDLDERGGGLNIEGLTRPPTNEDAIVFGFRGPQFGGNFPNDLVSGHAILAKVNNPFGANPTWEFTTVDLEGFGFRGVEWIPALNSYVAIGGPLERGNVYGLFRVSPNGDAERLDLPGFSSLCRPESVMQQVKNGKYYLVVSSEESAAACDGTPFTYIRAEITNPVWEAGKVYLAGDYVTYNGSLWMASWWTQNQQPGDPWGPWQEIKTAEDGTIIWTASRIFLGGEEVLYNGHRYRAKWWTRNQPPGDPWGPWQFLE